MTKEELEKFKEISAKAATAGLFVTLIEIVLCLTAKSALNAIWILITAL